ncbi:Putative amidohydrolase YtcJ [Tolypocladium paradoxum]|uniref:Amidohydrolase YtcJ n=1 Tax=Tolypocladium paradoxum TaxID=94208 RepID=A0A2S4KTW7_9HYPO|nr:Putative amidohydrolase YtcJ [Tolypocladium paradoxum]
MFSTPLLRWGCLFSVAAVAVAVALRLQSPLVDASARRAEHHYCYRHVRTHDRTRPRAECFTVKAGRFRRVWAEDRRPPGLPHIAARDGYAIPGLWDGHGHLLQYGQFLHSVDLFGSKSLDDVRDRIKAYRENNPRAGQRDHWIRGVGWDQAAFGRMPTAADLAQDPGLKDLYIMLDRVDVHCTWVSQAVLGLLPDDLPDVPDGEIIRAPGMGVFCDNAMKHVVDLWPKPKDAEKASAVKTAMARLNEVGLVGVHDAGSTRDDHELYACMADRDREDWTVRVYAMLECDQRNDLCTREARKVERDDSMFTVSSVKLFADGALGSWGSAMLEPYTDHHWTSGSLLINASDLAALTGSWAAAGYQVNIHAIGDLANRNAVDAFDAALKLLCPDDLAECQRRYRFRIEHAQIIHPDDQRRMRELGIIPSLQPTHATSDMAYALARLGPERIASEAYRMRSLLHVGPGPILGSDFPVEPPNPFHGVYAAVTRKNPATGLGVNGSAEGWHTEEALGLDDALWGFTGAAAYGAFLEGRAGVIQEGAFADWVVLDEPIEDMDIAKLRSLKVRETWVAGKRVFPKD